MDTRNLGDAINAVLKSSLEKDRNNLIVPWILREQKIETQTLEQKTDTLVMIKGYEGYEVRSKDSIQSNLKVPTDCGSVANGLFSLLVETTFNPQKEKKANKANLNELKNHIKTHKDVPYAIRMGVGDSHGYIILVTHFGGEDSKGYIYQSNTEVLMKHDQFSLSDYLNNGSKQIVIMDHLKRLETLINPDARPEEKISAYEQLFTLPDKKTDRDLSKVGTRQENIEWQSEKVTISLDTLQAKILKAEKSAYDELKKLQGKYAIQEQEDFFERFSEKLNSGEIKPGLDEDKVTLVEEKKKNEAKTKTVHDLTPEEREKIIFSRPPSPPKKY